MASRRSSSTSSFDSCGSGSSNASIGSFDVVDEESRPARAAETNVLMEALLNFTRQRSVLGQPATRDATDDVTTFSTPTNERFTPISAPLSARGVRDNTKTFDDAQAAAEAFLNQHPLQTHSELLEQFERIVDSDSDNDKAKESPVDDTANAAPDAAPTEVSDAQGDVEGLPDETSQLEELLDRFIEWVDAEDDAADEPDCFGDDDEANCKTSTGKSAAYLTRVNRIKQQQTSFLCKWVGLKTTTWELEDDLVEWGFGTWVQSYNREHPVTNKKQSPAREHGPRKSSDELLNDLTSDNRKCHAVDFDAMFPMMAEYILEEMTGCGLHPLRFARVDRQHLNANFAWEWRQALDNGDGVAPVRVFHGTRRENVASILRRGLLVPGQGNHLKHRATPKHGTGIYASFDPSFADCFCNPVIGEPTAPKLMFVCAGLMRRDMSTFADGHITVFARSTLILPVYLVEYTTRAGIDGHRPVRVSSRLLLTDEFARHRTAPWDVMAPEAARFTNAPGRTFGPSQASAWYTDPRAARAWEQNVHVESKRPAKATKPDGSWAPAPRAGTVEVGSGVRVKAEYVYTGVSRRSLKQMPKAIRDAFRNGEVKQAERGRDKKAFQRRRDRN